MLTALPTIPRKLQVVSAFTGIAGFDLGFEAAGMEVTHQIEWDPSCQKVLRRHYPHVNLMGNICDVTGTDLGRPDVLAGGFPCQNTSIGAPHREGLAGSKSQHFFEFARLVGEVARLVDTSRPEWVVIENPPGLLKSNAGRDMATVARTLEDLGYGWAYRVVDCRSVGSAQRRPRVVIVGVRGGDARLAQSVLADYGTGDIAAGLRLEQTGDVRPGVPATADGSRLFRKRSNPRGKASEGAWASYDQQGFFNTLTNNDSGSNLRQKHIVLQGGRLRALTPVEWERLQGFPDTWTEGIPDRERFLALGDAMNVNLAEWLGRRIMHVEKSLPSIEPAAV